MPPGTGDIQMALVAAAAAGRDARGHHARAGRAEGRGARRRHGAPLVPQGARRRREHDTSSSRPTARSHAIFGSGGGQRLAALTGAPLVGAVPIEAAVSEGGDVGQARRARAPRAARGAGAHRRSRGGSSTSSCRRSRWPAAPRACSSSCRSSRRRPSHADPVSGEPRREQALVFGEIAEQYDAFAAVVSRRALRHDHRVRRAASRATPRSRSARAPARRRWASSRAGSRCTRSNRARRWRRVLRAKGVDGGGDDVRGRGRSATGAFRLVFAAQAWHWVQRRRPLREGRGRARAGWHGRVVLERGPRLDRSRSATDNDAVYDAARAAPDELGRQRAAVGPRSSRRLAACASVRAARRAHGHVGDVVHERRSGCACSGRTPTTACSPTSSAHRAPRRDRRGRSTRTAAACRVVYDVECYLATRR